MKNKDALLEFKQYLIVEKNASERTIENYIRDVQAFFNYIATRSRDPTDSAPTVPAVVWTLHFHSQYGRRVSSPVLSVC